MPQTNTQEAIPVKVFRPGEMLKARLRSSSYAQKHLTAQQVHRAMRKNGSVPSPNPFYDGRMSEEESYQRLNSVR